jgi:hypothetical protein
VGDLARYFVTANEPTIGFSRALEVMSFEMSPQATWLAGPAEVDLIGEAPSSSLIWFVGLVICLCAATMWVWLSSEDSLRRRFLNSAPVVWALLVAGTIAVAQVSGYLFPYVVLWRSVIVIFVGPHHSDPPTMGHGGGDWCVCSQSDWRNLARN